MFRTITALLCLGFAIAADAAPLPPKVDGLYRAYLAALAKDYQSETAKFDAQLKREAAAAKKDSDTAVAIAALQERVKAGKQLDDFAALVTSNLLDPVTILGGEAALIGAWSLDPRESGYADTSWTVTIKPDHTATQEFVGARGKQTNQLKWAIRNDQAVVTVADDVYCLRQWFIDLPLPAAGPITITDKYTGRGQSAGNNQESTLHAKRKIP